MKTFALILALVVGAPLAMSGCGRTVSESSKTTTDSNGVQKTESKTVTQNDNGGTTVTKEKSVTNP